jgi:hypothetical protein
MGGGIWGGQKWGNLTGQRGSLLFPSTAKTL